MPEVVLPPVADDVVPAEAVPVLEAEVPADVPAEVVVEVEPEVELMPVLATPPLVAPEPLVLLPLVLEQATSNPEMNPALT